MARERSSVLVPAWNERPTIERLLNAVVAVDAGVDLQVLVADDGSTDGTRDILSCLDLPGVQVIFMDENVGRGGGYIISSSNSLTDYCKTENVLAMADAVRKYGKY